MVRNLVCRNHEVFLRQFRQPPKAQSHQYRRQVRFCFPQAVVNPFLLLRIVPPFQTRGHYFLQKVMYFLVSLQFQIVQKYPRVLQKCLLSLLRLLIKIDQDAQMAYLGRHLAFRTVRYFLRLPQH